MSFSKSFLVRHVELFPSKSRRRREVRQPDVRLWFLPRLPPTASKCKAQLMPAALPLSILLLIPHVWILVHSFQMTAAGLIWTSQPHTHKTQACGNVIVPLYFYWGLQSVDCNAAVWPFEAGTGPGPWPPSTRPVGLTFHLFTSCLRHASLSGFAWSLRSKECVCSL